MKIYLTTCDQYRHLMYGFSYLFNKYWSKQQDVVILCYKEPDQIKLPSNFTIYSLGKQPKNGIWTNNLIDFFSTIDDEYFIFMMEDYYIYEQVRIDYINILEKYLYNADVSKIDLTDDRTKNEYTEYDVVGDLKIIESSQSSDYRSSTQTAIWKKDYFYNLLKPNRNPWEFEMLGMKELRNDGKKILGTKNHIVKNIEMMIKGKINYSKNGLCLINNEDVEFMRNNNLIYF